MSIRYCGCKETFGHGDVAQCGEPYYTNELYQCKNCQIATLKMQVERLMEVSQHSLSEVKYLEEVGLYADKDPRKAP